MLEADDTALVKRVRNLARLKMLTDEMLMHANAEEQMGLAVASVVPFDQVARRGKRLVLEDHDRSYELILNFFQGRFYPDAPACALLQLQDGHFDL